MIPRCDAGGLRAVLPMHRAHVCLCTLTIAIYALPQKGLPPESYRALSPTGFYSSLLYQRVLPCLTTGSKIQAYFILVCFALLGFINIAFLFFLQIKGLQQPCVRQVCQHHFPNSMSSVHVSVSHFVNSRNILNVPTIIIFVMVISDQSLL